MLTSTGRFETEAASKYLQQLCKHFAHKVEVSYTAETGDAALPPGRAILRAGADALEVTVTAQDPDGLSAAKHIIDSHLERFAFREGVKEMDWSDA